MIAPRSDVPDVLEIHPMRPYPRKFRRGGPVILLPRQVVYQIQSHARHRHLELLPLRRGVDAALGQLGDEIGIRLIGEMARALAAVEPALAIERTGRPHDLEMHRDSGSGHVGLGEAHELAERYGPAPVTRVSTFAVADVELDFAGLVTGFDQPLPVRGDGMLRRERRSCQEAGDEEDGEPHGDSRGGFGELDRQAHSMVAINSENFSRSILPPETMATRGPLPALPVSAAARLSAPAPSAMTRAFSARSRIARFTSSRVTTMEPSTTGCMRCHMRGNTLLPPAPSTNVAFQSGNTCAEPLANESAAGAAVSRSAPPTLISGRHAFTALAPPRIR